MDHPCRLAAAANYGRNISRRYSAGCPTICDIIGQFAPCNSEPFAAAFANSLPSQDRTAHTSPSAKGIQPCQFRRARAILARPVPRTDCRPSIPETKSGTMSTPRAWHSKNGCRPPPNCAARIRSASALRRKHRFPPSGAAGSSPVWRYNRAAVVHQQAGRNHRDSRSAPHSAGLADAEPGSRRDKAAPMGDHRS